MSSGAINLGSSINWSHPLNKGLVTRWICTPTQLNGFLLRDVCRCNHGTLTSFTSAGGWRPTNRLGGAGAIRIEAADGCKVQASSAVGLPSTTTFSFAIWVAVRSYTSLASICNFGQATSSGNFGRRRAILQFSSAIYFWGDNADWSTGVSWDTSGASHRLMFTSDGTTLGLFVDGVQAASTSTPGALTTLTSADTYLTLGDRHSGGTTSPDMDVDDYTIWSRCLPAADAEADYDLSRQRYPGVLNRIANYAFNPPVTLPLIDWQPNFLAPQTVVAPRLQVTVF